MTVVDLLFAGSNSDGVVLDIEPEIDDTPTAWQFALFHPPPTLR